MIYEFNVSIGDDLNGDVKKVGLIAEYSIDNYGDVEVLRFYAGNPYPEFIDYAIVHLYNWMEDYSQIENDIYRSIKQ